MVQQLQKPITQILEPDISNLITEDDTPAEEIEEILEPDISNLITEDDTPVDNFCSEKQQRFLTSVLYSSKPREVFLAAANVGIYHNLGEPAIVPDVFLSLDVETPQNWWEKAHRCYLVWQFGKTPEVAIEIVSNKVGEELGTKLNIYEKMRVSYYVVYDPAKRLGDSILRIFEIKGRKYFETKETWLEQVELGLTLWQGEFEGRNDLWLRWCDKDGNILLSGDERAKKAETKAQEAETKAQEAETKAQEAEIKAQEAEIKAQKLAAQLRALGIEPE
jgi:Uma2 family endonuclease